MYFSLERCRYHDDDFIRQYIFLNGEGISADNCDSNPNYESEAITCGGMDEPGAGQAVYQYCTNLGLQTELDVFSCDLRNMYLACGESNAAAPAAICLTPPCMPPAGPNSTLISLVNSTDCVHSTGGKDVLEITDTSMFLEQADFGRNGTLNVNVYITLSHKLPPGEQLVVAVKFYDKKIHGKLHIAHGWLTTSNDTSLTVELNKNYILPLTVEETKTFQDADGLRVKIKRKSSDKTQPKLAVCQNWKRVF